MAQQFAFDTEEERFTSTSVKYLSSHDGNQMNFMSVGSVEDILSSSDEELENIELLARC